jgi:hypothetical protein
MPIPPQTSHADDPSDPIRGTLNNFLQNLISVPSVTSHTLFIPLHTKKIQIGKSISFSYTTVAV